MLDFLGNNAYISELINLKTWHHENTYCAGVITSFLIGCLR
jgi:hypothetical protein